MADRLQFFQVPSAIVELGPELTHLYCIMLRLAGSRDATFASQKRIALDCKVSLRTIRRRLKDLAVKAPEWFRADVRFDEKHQQITNCYVITKVSQVRVQERVGRSTILSLEQYAAENPEWWSRRAQELRQITPLVNRYLQHRANRNNSVSEDSIDEVVKECLKLGDDLEHAVHNCITYGWSKLVGRRRPVSDKRRGARGIPEGQNLPSS